jgi:hypothetical protein
MDPIFRVMCDVAGLVTRGSDAARIEVRSTALEHERLAAPAPSSDVPAASATKRALQRPRRWLRLALLPR